MADIEPAAAPECASCRFFVRIAEGGGMCRRFPPVPIMTGLAPPTLAGRPPTPLINTFPVQVPNDYWCGEHVLGRAPEPAPVSFDVSKITRGQLLQPQDRDSRGEPQLIDVEGET